MSVHIVPLTEIQEQIRKQCPEEYFTLITRRFMMRIADRLAKEFDCRALVTGENLGQVASQTMEALRVSEDVTDLPVLRPLIGMDKEEIVRIAHGLYPAPSQDQAPCGGGAGDRERAGYRRPDGAGHERAGSG